MKCTTWGFNQGENGKVIPVKIEKTIDENIMASAEALLKGVEVSL